MTDAKIGMHRSGPSVRCKGLLKGFAFTPENVFDATKQRLPPSKELS
jgi:hypothetical protein